MAEVVIGLIASCLTLMETIERVNKTVRRNIRTNAAAKKELVPLLGKLVAYEGLIKAIKLEAEFDEPDHGRLSALYYVNGPIHSCQIALEVISNRLDYLPKHIVLGKLLDDGTTKALKMLDESGQILQLALDADQRTISKSVEHYVVNFTEDLRGFRAEAETHFQTLRENLTKLCDRNQALTDYEQYAAQEDDRQRIRQWLTPCDPSRIYDQSIQIPLPGSGKWFVDHLFRNWITSISSSDTQTSIMWLLGRSGLGKTVLTSIALHYTKTLASDSKSFILAYFYCSFTDKASQDPANVIGSFVAQVCDQVPQLWSKAGELQVNVLSDAQRHNKQPTLTELVGLLADCYRNVPNLVLFLDAPNESEKLLELMAALRTVCGCEVGLRLFVSSTEDIDVSLLDNPVTTATYVYMDANMIDYDIGVFIEAQLKDQPRLSRLPQSLKADIKSGLVSQAQGSFRWAQCQLESLAEQARSPTSIRLALEVISPGLDKLYSDTLLAVPPSDLRYVRAALLWLTYAWRPLQLAELSEAMILEGEGTVFDTQERLLFPLDILRPCRMLVSFNASSGRVTLAHSSVREYMRSQYVQSGGLTERYAGYQDPFHLVGRLCVRYLSLPSFQSGYCLTKEEKIQRKADWPLLEYACGWPFYARIALKSPECGERQMFETLWKFFKTSELSRGGNFGAWIQLYIPRHIRGGDLSRPLYYAAREGLNDLVKLILKVEGKVNLEVPGGSRGSTPLHVASAFGHLEVVRTLLAVGANPHEKNRYGERGIDFAADSGYPEVVQALLDAGAEKPQGLALPGDEDDIIEVETSSINEADNTKTLQELENESEIGVHSEEIGVEQWLSFQDDFGDSHYRAMRAR